MAGCLNDSAGCVYPARHRLESAPPKKPVPWRRRSLARVERRGRKSAKQRAAETCPRLSAAGQRRAQGRGVSIGQPEPGGRRSFTALTRSGPPFPHPCPLYEDHRDERSNASKKADCQIVSVERSEGEHASQSRQVNDEGEHARRIRSAARSSADRPVHRCALPSVCKGERTA